MPKEALNCSELMKRIADSFGTKVNKDLQQCGVTLSQMKMLIHLGDSFSGSATLKELEKSPWHIASYHRGHRSAVGKEKAPHRFHRPTGQARKARLPLKKRVGDVLRRASAYRRGGGKACDRAYRRRARATKKAVAKNIRYAEIN